MRWLTRRLWALERRIRGASDRMERQSEIVRAEIEDQRRAEVIRGPWL